MKDVSRQLWRFDHCRLSGQGAKIRFSYSAVRLPTDWPYFFQICVAKMVGEDEVEALLADYGVTSVGELNGQSFRYDSSNPQPWRPNQRSIPCPS